MANDFKQEEISLKQKFLTEDEVRQTVMAMMANFTGTTKIKIGNITIDGPNNRITISDGTNIVVLIDGNA